MRLLPALTAAALACAVVPVQAQTPARPAAKAGKKSAAELEAEAKAVAEAEAKAKADAAAAAAAAAAADDAAKAKAAADAEAAARAAESKAAAERAAAEARGLEARIRILADALALPMKRLPGDHRDQRFAVMPFESAGPEAQERSLGLVVSDLLTTGLVRDHRLPLTERSQIGTVMTELALQQSGAVDDAQAAQVGKLAAARAIVVGRVSDGGEFFLVSARAVDSESGAVVVATEARLPKAELIAFSADAVVLKSRSGAMFRSMVAPGWGQSYNGDDAKAFVLGGITVGAAASTVVVGGLGLYNGFFVYPNIEKGPGEDPRKVSETVANTRVVANTQLTAAAVLAGITAVAWGVTAAEAWLSGTDVDSLDAALAKN